MKFKKYDYKHKISYKEDVDKIRTYLVSIGELEATDEELDFAWSSFNENRYSAGWLNVSEKLLEQFADWLETKYNF